MKQTQKYSGACNILTYPHSNQEELYQELNRLGWWWDAKKKTWIRDDTPAREATNLIRVRVMASNKKVAEAAQHSVEASGDTGLNLIEQSEPYPCRPPLQLESRIYLTFEEVREGQ